MEVYLLFHSTAPNNSATTHTNVSSATSTSISTSTSTSSISESACYTNFLKHKLFFSNNSNKHVTIILDNCSVNKSYKSIANIVNLVECGWYDSVQLLFLYPNHAKFQADQIMGMYIIYRICV
jgi:maltodextrin utilization protein YvdJ